MGAGDSDVLLYHAPPSFYSQIARLVLAEKGVAYEAKLLLAGPPTCESYEPWYMRLNPGGTVPTLLIGDVVLDDSRKILHGVDERFDGPALTPTDDAERGVMERWIDESYALPERIVAYGSDRMRTVGRFANGRRRAALVKHRAKNPDLRSVYDAKIADIDGFMREAEDRERHSEVRDMYAAALDELDRHLADRAHVCGDAYTLADVVWTVSVARQHALGAVPLEGRSALEGWYRRIKARPSFVEADIWEKMQPTKLVKALWGRLTS